MSPRPENRNQEIKESLNHTKVHLTLIFLNLSLLPRLNTELTSQLT